jgi:hypothetical protein
MQPENFIARPGVMGRTAKGNIFRLAHVNGVWTYTRCTILAAAAMAEQLRVALCLGRRTGLTMMDKLTV